MKYLLFFLLFLFFSCNGKKQLTEDIYRPSLHFSTEQNWTGEPTGLIFYEGIYHLFYQYNRSGGSSDVSWGHIVSNDMITWEQASISTSFDSALHVGAGSVVIDEKNTSAFSTTQVPPFIAFYTKKQFCDNKETEMVYISLSPDKGTTWVENPEPVLNSVENPILQYPKVRWNEKLNQWLMTVSTGDDILFYSSQNCKDWEYLSRFDNSGYSGKWESADLFSLMDCETNRQQWVLLINMGYGPMGETPATRYFVGDFDISGFRVTQSELLLTDSRLEHYAAMTFSNSEEERTVLLAWMNYWSYANIMPGITWKGVLAIPRELTLSLENNRFYWLTSAPIKELDKVWVKEAYLGGDFEFSEEFLLMEEDRKRSELSYEVNLSFNVSERTFLSAPSDYGIRFKTRTGSSLELGYNAQNHYFYIDQSGIIKKETVESLGERVGAAYVLKSDTVEWKILVDGSCVEFFGADGKVALSSLQFSDEPFVSLELFSKNGKTKLIRGIIRTR